MRDNLLEKAYCVMLALFFPLSCSPLTRSSRVVNDTVLLFVTIFLRSRNLGGVAFLDTCEQ